MVDKKEIIILIFVILVLLGVVLYLKNVEIESIGEKSDSERTISIISAEKLDKDYNFVEDIYEKVSKKDKNYALIDEGIVKVKFEREISNANDISFYAESEDGVKVSIYSEDEVLLSNINVKNYKLYQSFFKGLKRPSNTFYLKVNGTLKLDYIFDPLSLKVNISDISIDTHVLNITLENNFSHLTISNVTPYYGVGSISRVKELVIYYSFDVNHTNNITHDYTRWDNDGTVFLNGTGNWTKNCGMFGGCYNFDGDGDFINVTKSTTNESLRVKNFNDDNAFSFTIWFKTDVSSNITKKNQSLINFFNQSLLYISTYNNITTNADQSGQTCGMGGNPYGGLNITIGKWHFAALIINDSSSTAVSIYLDNRTGLNCGSYGSGPTFQNGTTLWIGVDNTYGSYFNGSIDEFMFFQNTSLTAQQVLDIYNNQSPRFNSSGQQNFGNQSVFSISPGDTEVTVTGQVLNYSNSSVNLSIGYYNGSWFNATPQVFIGNNTFTIDAQSTNLTLNFTFYAGNSSAVSFLGGHNFYSPILSSVTKNLIIYLNDSANPSVSITSPTNKTNSSNTGLDVNFTVSDTSLQACWYSNDTYSVNRSLVCTGANSNLTNITWSQGNHNVTIYANDSYNNQNKSTVSFSIDSIAPDINITSPINKTESTDTGLDILYTRSDINLESCWYSNDSYSVNTTLASCGNLTTITWVVGLHNVTIYVNDSHGNQNRSSVTFNITSSGGSGGSSGGGGGGGSGGTSSSPNTKSSDNKIPENDNKKEEIIKQPEIPKEFICGEWEKCNVNYELNNIDSSILRGEQTRKCTDGETERIDRRECSYSQEISIKKFYEEGEEKKLHILDLKNDPIADIDIIEKIDKDGNLVEKLNLKFYV